jgi:hypothetical protein
MVCFQVRRSPLVLTMLKKYIQLGFVVNTDDRECFQLEQTDKSASKSLLSKTCANTFKFIILKPNSLIDLLNLSIQRSSLLSTRQWDLGTRPLSARFGTDRKKQPSYGQPS